MLPQYLRSAATQQPIEDHRCSIESLCRGFRYKRLYLRALSKGVSSIPVFADYIGMSSLL
jgi:hypothetical protein